MALVEEYFPDAKAVELPESVRQMTPPDAEQAGYQQPVTSGQISSSGRDDAKQASAQQPARAASASAGSIHPSSTVSTTENTESIPAGPLPTRDEVTVAWGNEIFGALSPPLKRRFSIARFLESQDNAVRLAMPAAAVASITAEQHQEIEAKLAEHFGYRVAVLLAEDDRSTPAPPDSEALISKDASDISLDTSADKIFANEAEATEAAEETATPSSSTASRTESANGTGAAGETDSAEDKLLKAISHDAAMVIEAEALEAPQEVVPNIPQDSLFV